MLCTVQNAEEIQRRNRKEFHHETALNAFKLPYSKFFLKLLNLSSRAPSCMPDALNILKKKSLLASLP
jgi:hypothetical protein